MSLTTDPIMPDSTTSGILNNPRFYGGQVIDYVQAVQQKISIACLIYKSSQYCDFIYDQVQRHTPQLKYGSAEFFFVVNFQKSVSEKVVEHLKNKGYKFFVYDKNPEQKKYPENISDIYNAWNFAVEKAEGTHVCLINSDMAFCDDQWLVSLMHNYSDDKIVTSRLVESGKMPSGNYGISQFFGNSPETYKEKEFKEFAQQVKIEKLSYGGLYCPFIIRKNLFQKAGGYPSGNEFGVAGDKIFFYQKLAKLGIRHYTSFDSVVYHFQNGEVDSE